MTRTNRYLANVLWSWTGVLTTIVIAFLLSPYIIRRIGDVNFGIWTLALSLIEYYWLMDLGFRSATVNMSAQFRAKGDYQQLNELLNTGVLYAAIAATLVFIVALILAPYTALFWGLKQPEFPGLVRMVAASWALGMVFTILSSCLEGHQRFDLTTRVWLLQMIVRSVGIVVLLRMGYGVRQMGIMLLVSQCAGYALTYILFRRAVPQVHLSLGGATLSMLRRMAAYGIHTFTSTVSNLLLNKSVPLLIPVFINIRYLAYYTVPARILDYATDGIGRIGMVTAPNAAELMASGRSQALIQLSIYSNRYSFTIFAPMGIFLITYGFELYSLWIRPDFARECAFLLPILLIGQLVMAGQQNSVSVLFGMGRHKTYSRFVLAEALLSTAGVALVLPHYGLAGVAWVVSIFMAVNRGVIVCWLTARELGVNAFWYAMKIYAIPAVISLGVGLMLVGLKMAWFPGHSWRELILAGLAMGVVYSLLAFRFCVAEHHREQAIRILTNRLAFRAAAAADSRL